MAKSRKTKPAIKLHYRGTHLVDEDSGRTLCGSCVEDEKKAKTEPKSDRTLETVTLLCGNPACPVTETSIYKRTADKGVEALDARCGRCGGAFAKMFRAADAHIPATRIALLEREVTVLKARLEGEQREKHDLQIEARAVDRVLSALAGQPGRFPHRY